MLIMCERQGKPSDKEWELLCATVSIGNLNKFAQSDKLPVAQIKSRMARRKVRFDTIGLKVLQYFWWRNRDRFLESYNLAPLTKKSSNGVARLHMSPLHNGVDNFRGTPKNGGGR